MCHHNNTFARKKNANSTCMYVSCLHTNVCHYCSYNLRISIGNLAEDQDIRGVYQIECASQCNFACIYRTNFYFILNKRSEYVLKNINSKIRTKKNKYFLPKFELQVTLLANHDFLHSFFLNFQLIFYFS